MFAHNSASAWSACNIPHATWPTLTACTDSFQPAQSPASDNVTCAPVRLAYKHCLQTACGPGLYSSNCAGLSDLEGKQYLRPKLEPALPLLLFLAVRMLLPAWQLEAGPSCRLRRRPGRAAPDPAAMASGMAVLLQQFPPAYLQVCCG